MSKDVEKEPRGPEVIGHSLLIDEEEGHRFRFRYFAPADLHPYYDRLIEENKNTLLEEANEERENVLDVTERFKTKARQLYANR